MRCGRSADVWRVVLTNVDVRPRSPSAPSVASLGWVTAGAATEGVTPLFFTLKPGYGVTPVYFLLKTDDIFCLSPHHCHFFLLISLECHPPPWRVSPRTFLHLSDLLSPLFFVNFPTNFFPSGVTPWRVSPEAVRPPVTPMNSVLPPRHQHTQLSRALSDRLWATEYFESSVKQSASSRESHRVFDQHLHAIDEDIIIYRSHFDSTVCNLILSILS